MATSVRHEALIRWLDEHGIAHHEFAEAMDRAPATVSNWLHLRGRPDLETLDRISRFTGISMQTLVDGFLRRSAEPAARRESTNVTDLRVARLRRRTANKNG